MAKAVSGSACESVMWETWRRMAAKIGVPRHPDERFGVYLTRPQGLQTALRRQRVSASQAARAPPVCAICGTKINQGKDASEPPRRK
ncbi:protein of unknown function [Paraburkholderia dioscoreae]|uniref:Uncharacterized protein n=1 Tax=Paraburkholderia dioscoreae TaxID=2604047 RepID=A0A5Q4ZJ92_9BURK|nr:protein of unknown function [Paraburkholderia dioscoreae]